MHTHAPALAAFAALEVDTFVICDTHWFTTTEHVIAGAARFSGCGTMRFAVSNLCSRRCMFST